MNTSRSPENPLSTRRRFAPALLLHSSSPKTFFRGGGLEPRTAAFNSLLGNDAAPRSETSKLPGRDSGWMRAGKWKLRTHSIRRRRRRRRGLRVHAPARAGKLLGHERARGDGGSRPTSAPLSRARGEKCTRRWWKLRSFFPALRVYAKMGPRAAVTSDRDPVCECRARGTYRGSRRNGERSWERSPRSRNERDRASCAPRRKSYDYGRCASLDRITGIRTGSGRPLTCPPDDEVTTTGGEGDEVNIARLGWGIIAAVR